MTLSREEQREMLVAQAQQPGRKEISAMIRVKNEQEFLSSAVLSIMELVDEVVLIDNLSRDSTPQIIGDLENDFPEKVRVFSYPHDILRVGKENWDYSTNPDTQNSPRLSANYYSWCLKQCTRPYVLKWDADMIALDCLSQSLELWRNEKKSALSFFGWNVHPDRSCYLAPLCTDREALLARLIEPTLPWWVTVLTRDALEPRLFPRQFADYGLGKHWTQGLDTPGLDREVRTKLELRLEDANFLHMKFCKQDPYSNYSPDLAKVIASNITTGPLLHDEGRSVLERYRLVN